MAKILIFILLGFVDSGYLIIMVIGKCLAENILSTDILIFPHWYIILFPYGLHPLEYFFGFAEVYFIMALSFERYQAFCSPFDHRAKFWPYFITGICTSITWFFRCLFDFEFEFDDNGEVVRFVFTKLFSNPRYNNIFFNFLEVCFIASCFVIVLLNIKIYLHLRSVKNSSKYKSARVLFLIVMTFLFCHGVRIVITAFMMDQHIKEYCFLQGR